MSMQPVLIDPEPIKLRVVTPESKDLPFLFKKFNQLNCSDDVWESTKSLHNWTNKVVEAMGVIKYLKRLVLSEPGEYTLVDTYSTNPITAVIAQHLLPVKKTFIVQSQFRPALEDNLRRVDNLMYLKRRPSSLDLTEFGSRVIILSTVPSIPTNTIIGNYFNQCDLESAFIILENMENFPRQKNHTGISYLISPELAHINSICNLWDGVGVYYNYLIRTKNQYLLTDMQL